MSRLTASVAIAFVYLAITGSFAPANLVAGLLIGGAITLLLAPERRSGRLHRLPSAIGAFLRYLLVIAVDLAVSGWQTARLLLSRELNIRPGIITIPSGCESELATALSAHAISLAPGELVVEVDEHGVMYTHCLDVTRSAEYVADAQQLRRDLLVKIFE
jgi:multicomponent Na+:H+ antiporter subunit E